MLTPEMLASMTPKPATRPIPPPATPDSSVPAYTPEVLAAMDQDVAVAQNQVEQAREETSALGTAALQFSRGVLDIVTAPGALAAMGLEGLGSAVGSEGLETFGRELGESASGDQALQALAFAAGAPLGKGLEAWEATDEEIDKQERARPLFSTIARGAGMAAAGAALGGVAGAAAAPESILGGLAARSAVYAAEGAASGAQTAYQSDAPIRDVFTSALIGGAIGAVSMPISAGVSAAGIAAGGPLSVMGAVSAVKLAHIVAPDKVGRGLAWAYQRALGQAVSPRASRLATVLGIAAEGKRRGLQEAIVRSSVWGYGKTKELIGETQESYDKAVEKLNGIVNDPAQESVTSQLRELPEAIGAAVAIDFNEKLNKLAQDMPKAPVTLRGKGKLNREELKRGRAMYEATLAPLTVFDDLASGTLNPEKASYAWQQYPGLKDASQALVLDMVYFQMSDQQRARVPLNVLTQLDNAFGFEGRLSETVSEGFSKSIDQMGAELAQSDQQQRPQAQLNTPLSQPTFTERVARGQ